MSRMFEKSISHWGVFDVHINYIDGFVGYLNYPEFIAVSVGSPE